MFGVENLGKSAMYIGIAVIPRLCCPVSHFHQFYTSPPIFLVKIILS